MRIAVWHNTGAGGARRHLYQHIRGLVQRGHEVESWCLSSSDQAFLALGRLVPEHVQQLDWPVETGSFLAARVRARANATTDMLQSVGRACQNCAAEIARGRFDLLFSTNCRLSGIPPIARYVHIPSVIYIHEPWRPMYEALPELPWKAPPPIDMFSRFRFKRAVQDFLDTRGRRIFVREEAESAGAFKRRLVNSSFGRESVLRAYGLDSRVCYQGIDLGLFRPLGLLREQVVLGVGAYAFHKDIPFAIQSVAAIPEPRPRLIWVGNGGSRALLNELKDEAASRGVFLDALFGVGDEELIRLYNRAKVLLCVPRLEPFGLAALEANACGLPVVAVAEGGLRETIRDGVNGFLVEHDPESVAAGLQRLLANEALAREMGEQGRALVERGWGLEESTMRLESELRQVL